MDSGDSTRAAGGAQRRVAPASSRVDESLRVADDTARDTDRDLITAADVVDGRAATARPDGSGATYARSSSGSVDSGPLAVRIELVVIEAGTPEANDLLIKQGAVVRRILQWFADHPAPDEGNSP